MVAQQTLLTARHVTFGYLVDRPLFRDLSFSVAAGECLHVQGGNGAGKSTLLKLMLGLVTPHVGEILWGDHSLASGLSTYLEHVVYVGHQHGLSEALTLHENLTLDWHWREGFEVASSVMRDLHVETCLHQPVARLSQGQQRKAALLRLWMTTANVWVLDEPFVSLDASAVQILSQWVQQHLAKGGRVMLTSHQCEVAWLRQARTLSL